MSRIQACFAELAERKRTGLIPYVVGGDPTMQRLPDLLDAAVENGADLIEVGVPFSDPMADGPSIQRGHERALAQGASLGAILAAVKDFRRRQSRVPLVLMSYTNPIKARGHDRFVEEAVEAGIDGVLLVDLPYSERPEDFAVIKAAGLDPIFLVSPNTEEARVRSLAGAASGYIYYVSLKGVTGADHIDLAETAPRLNRLKQLLPLPVASASASAIRPWPRLWPPRPTPSSSAAIWSISSAGIRQRPIWRGVSATASPSSARLWDA